MPQGEKTVPVMCLLPAGDFTRVYTSLTSRPMTVVFGLGTRLCVCMRTNLDSSLRMALVDQGEFEAMKMLSGCRTLHCDRH